MSTSPLAAPDPQALLSPAAPGRSLPGVPPDAGCGPGLPQPDL